MGMKIAVIRKKYTFHGGAEGFSQGFIELLAKEGHEVHIYAIQWEKGEAKKNKVNYTSLIWPND